MAELEARVAQALKDALAQAVPDTPSGHHRILVVGQIVVNIKNDDGEGPRRL